MTSLTLRGLYRAVAKGYNNEYLDLMDRDDNLAKFIRKELRASFNPEASAVDQIREARRVVYRAKEKLESVATVLSDGLYQLSTSTKTTPKKGGS